MFQKVWKIFAKRSKGPNIGFSFEPENILYPLNGIKYFYPLILLNQFLNSFIRQTEMSCYEFIINYRAASITSSWNQTSLQILHLIVFVNQLNLKIDFFSERFQNLIVMCFISGLT